MGHVEKLSVSLPPELGEAVRQAVASGDYATESEVVREALREWKLRQALRAAGVEELRCLWDEGLASGPGKDGKVVFDRLRARLAAGREVFDVPPHASSRQ